MKQTSYYSICRVVMVLWVVGQVSLSAAQMNLATQMNAPVPVSFAPYRDPWPSAKERWWDISNHLERQFDAFLGLDPASYQPWSYALNPSVTLTYDTAPSGSYFVGRIDATNLKPNFAYQLKLLGKPVKGTRGWGAEGDDVANERLGYAGRWWCDSPVHAAGTNFDDSHYLNFYKNAPANGNAVHNIYGYLFSGIFVTDKFGAASVEFTGQHSYHITWQDWQGGAKQVLAGTWLVNGGLLSSSPTVYYGYGSTAPYQSVTLWYEREPGRPDPVTLAAGTYRCRFLLTEESFHNTATNGGYWKSVLATEDLSYDAGGNVSGHDLSASNDIVFTIGGAATRPAAPDSLTATAGDGQVALSWSASNGATSYNVKRSTTSGSGYTLLASGITTSYTDAEVVNGTTYYYIVSAANAAGEGLNSIQAAATPRVAEPEPTATPTATPEPTVIPTPTVMPTATPTPLPATLTPVADTFVRAKNYATTNYGSVGTLEVKSSKTAAENRDAYFKFSLSSITSVGSAKLRIYAALSGTGSGSTVSTSVHSVSSTAWTESGITWNIKPPLGSVLDSASVIAKTYAWYELDVTSYLRSELAAGRKVISLALHNPAYSNLVINMNSREAANPPQLVIRG